MSKDGDHELIPRTEAKTTFLLRDFDFEEREEGKALKFITRKNPHNPGGGAMKLYLRLQVSVADPVIIGRPLDPNLVKSIKK